VDGSAAGTKGLREAMRLAKDTRAELVILHVVSEFYAYYTIEGAGLGTDVYDALRESGRRVLDKAEKLAKAQGLKAKPVMREIVGGAAADTIVREAKKQRADLIVLGTHGRRGVRRLVMGSDAEQVVRTAPVPVLLVR
jgi:nucleotide-binding universal stress UspA family protein